MRPLPNPAPSRRQHDNADQPGPFGHIISDPLLTSHSYSMKERTLPLSSLFDPPTPAHLPTASSSSAFSLQTLPPYATLDTSSPRAKMSDLSRQILARNRTSRISTTTDGDGASFVTARGTLRSVKPDGTINDEQVLVWIGAEHLEPPESPISTIRTSSVDNDETPFPSRVLRLYHPPKELRGVQHSIHKFFEVGSWELLASAKEGMERAFWGLIMPSIAGLRGIGDTVTELVEGLTLPIILNTRSETPSIIDSNSNSHITDRLPHQARLYADETIYTLRLPKESVQALDLENTAKPVMIRKRAGIPAWKDREDKGLG